MTRCLVKERQLDAVEDVLAGIVRVSLNAERALDLVDALRANRAATLDPRVSARVLGALDALAADTIGRCHTMRRRVIAVTGYPYGRDPVAEEVAA